VYVYVYMCVCMYMYMCMYIYVYSIYVPGPAFILSSLLASGLCSEQCKYSLCIQYGYAGVYVCVGILLKVYS
jgi:hypothetical protein